MTGQIIALLLICFFLLKLVKQKKAKKTSQNEFNFWLIFWLISALAIIFIKKIDLFLASLGISASGINFLAYIGILTLFYYLFRLRLKIVKMEKTITEIIRNQALKK